MVFAFLLENLLLVKIVLNLFKAMLRLDWTLIFTDESMFRSDYNDGRRRAWRQKTERFTECYAVEFGPGLRWH